jgi:DNA-binding MarR family transcriptional regulator
LARSRSVTATVVTTIESASIVVTSLGGIGSWELAASSGRGSAGDRGTSDPRSLGERIIVTRATVTGLVDSLEQREFVHRSADPTDRRGLVVEITPAGLTVVRQLRTLVHRNEKASLSGLTEPELRGYLEYLHRIQDSLASVSEGSG